MIDSSFSGAFEGRRVLVTGHTGFKGGWLSLWLAELGAEVHGYALEPPTNPSFFHAVGLESRMASHRLGDVCDADALCMYVDLVRPEIVFHLAAQPLVRESYHDPARTYATNVMGTVNVLEATRKVGGVRVCQVITSDKCYENEEWVYAYRESDRLGGYDPYSSSKACAELLTLSYARSFFPTCRFADHGVSIATGRAGNVMGGGDWALDRLVPDCIRSMERGVAPVIRNPSSVRPWQLVLEPLSGYLHLAARQLSAPAEFAGSWNFGPAHDSCIPVQELVGLLHAAWGSAAPTAAFSSDVRTARDPMHEAGVLRLDTTKAQTMLRWRAVLGIQEAVEFTISWYRAAKESDPAELRRLSVTQIQRYSDRAFNAGVAWAPVRDGAEAV